MDPSFLFFLFLVLLVALITASDVVRWTDSLRTRQAKARKPVRAAPPAEAPAEAPRAD